MIKKEPPCRVVVEKFAPSHKQAISLMKWVGLFSAAWLCEGILLLGSLIVYDIFSP